MGQSVQVQIPGPDQGTRMAPTTSATKLAPTTSSSSAKSTRLGTSLLSLLLLPFSQALPQPAESQNWLARSTCVLDALVPGGVVDSQKFNQCMDCWRSSSDESLHTATTCLSSLPQFCKEDEMEGGKAGPLLCVELDGEVQNLVRKRRSPTGLTGGENLVRKRRSPTGLTGGGISFGSGFTLGSGLGLAGLGTAFNAATASLFSGLGLAALTG